MNSDNQLITVKETARILSLSRERVCNLCQSNLIDAHKINGRWQISKTSVLNYLYRHYSFGAHEFPRFDEVFKPITSNNGFEIFDVMKHEYMQKYLISNYGRVYSVYCSSFLQPDIKNGYYYLNLFPLNEELDEHRYIHALVAYFFCENHHYKKFIHHIDGNKLNNHYRNLIWVTDPQHKELHKLMDAGNKKAYRKRIREIQKENKW